MLEVKIRIDGLAAVLGGLTGIRDRTLYPDPALRRVATRLLEFQGEMFDTEGGVNRSGSWEALSAAYAAEKDLLFPGRTILVRTGVMREALTHDSSISFGRNVLVYQPDDPKAPLHQTGTRRMPARPVLDFPDEEILRWAEMVAEYVIEGTA